MSKNSFICGILPFPSSRPTNQCTRIAKRRLIETDWACGGALALQVVLLARNRVISSVSLQKYYSHFDKDTNNGIIFVW